MYNIKKNYIHRDNPEYFDDTQNTDEWQNEVYHLAYTIAKIIPKKPVLDIGCGSGYKLINIFKEFETVGIEINPTYEFLISKYPENNWLLKDNVSPKEDFGIIILSDVIEHVCNPDEMMNYVSNIKFDYLIISTPYKDSYDLSQDGPPKNLAHAREWTIKEMNDYTSSFFEIVNQFIINKSQRTQCLVCKKR